MLLYWEYELKKSHNRRSAEKRREINVYLTRSLVENQYNVYT
jgi:hypothetical protein